MADNVTISSSAVFDAATDDIGGKHVQIVKLMDGTDNSSTRVAYDANRGFIVQPNKVARISVTPTISTTLYSAGDAVGGLLTFANAARFSGGGIYLRRVTILDFDQEMAPLELVLFDRTFTASSDNAVFDPSDADLANFLAVVPISTYSNFNDNAVGVSNDVQMSMLLNGTSLFGQLVTRGTPTFTATTDITVIVSLQQE